jgi:hypothetical protein
VKDQKLVGLIGRLIALLLWNADRPQHLEIRKDASSNRG